jgi:hypothetical protein
MSEVHCFEVIQEGVHERAEPEFRDRIEIGERLDAAKKNCTELGAIVQGACQIAPLRSENIHCRLSSFLRLFSDLDSEINKGRDPNKHRRQLPKRCEHFPFHTFGTITVLT